ncbi:chromosomal replication initiation ATPase DnaA [Rhodobium orientis]|uniref:HdaA/DnaA family protein n=1 Tax=Rhodobium orientis TaxID=34017 RepID=UPI0017D3B67E|nr:hypothetical protein [Rhodobium orientis]MBB4302193.1 chromosomal replication initiation ATPase DnaA [Rhodobium orientis]
MSVVKRRPDEAAQLPLHLPHEASFARDDFLVADCNRAAFELVERWPDWPSKLVVLAGPTGSGKSHLADIWRERTGGTIIPADALSRADPLRLVEARAIAVEDADGATGAAGRCDDTALFHLLNAARAAGAFVLITCRHWPEAWGIRLADLKSRLRAATPVEIGEPDDDLIRRVLVKLFADRQISIDAAVVNYLLVRMERSLATASRLVAELDREALARGRAVTRPIAADVLARLSHGNGAEP